MKLLMMQSIKYNIIYIYFAISLVTVACEPALHRLLTFQRIHPSPRPFAILRNKLLTLWSVSAYPPYLEAVSSICNLSMHHAVVTRDPFNREATNTYRTSV
jgi:hypothetical protein